MIFNGFNKQYWLDSFIFKKLYEINDFWNWRIYSDHLSYLDYLKFIKNLKKDKHIFLSVESSVHSIKYYRPYNFSEFNITHKKVINSIFYNIFVEDYLNKIFHEINVESEKINKTVLISSNLQKISYVQKLYGANFNGLTLFGGFSRPVPTNSIFGYHRNAQSLIASYESAICIENSFEDGYIQGSFLPALLSGTVPIFHGSNSIKKNILNDGVFIDLIDYVSMSKKDRIYQLKKCKEKIIDRGRVFTTLAYEYFDFCKNMNLSNLSKTIKESQEFRRKIFVN